MAGIANGIGAALIMVWVIGGPGTDAMASFNEFFRPSPLLFLVVVVAFGMTLLLTWSRVALATGAVVLTLFGIVINLRFFGFGDLLSSPTLINPGLQPAPTS